MHVDVEATRIAADFLDKIPRYFDTATEVFRYWNGRGNYRVEKEHNDPPFDPAGA